ncbi:MAG: hydantoinase B/oxoprolinase family protein [Parvibaculaceae bacterium]
MTAPPKSAARSFDPITFEVIRHKLQAITEEQAITLKSISGSPVVTDATDFNNGLYLADGSIVTMGPQVIFHTGTMSTVIRSIIERFERNPGIRDGDMFILNDPYKGAIHQPDVSIVAPIFSEDRLIAWAGSCAHQLDTGGMSFGSWAYSATDVQQEAMLLPGIKIVENGEIREDIWQMIMGMTRLPDVVGLDLKGMIAANTVAARRLHELFDRYGEGTVVDVMHAEIDASERGMRERLGSLPDGIYRARDYIDHDGLSNALYRVCLAVEKRGDELAFDLTGTSPQAPGFINCTWSGMKGALLTGLLPILAPDIRWNEGVLRPVAIRAPEGIVCNARWPAPVSGATISTVWIVMNVAVAALSRLVSMTEATAGEAQAVTKGQMSVLTFGGRDRDGSRFGAFLLDSMAGGGGASIGRDGLDGSGDYDVPRPSIANVEANESSSPILYLFRSFVPDTGGPGRMRGGATTAVGLTPHDVEGFDATLVGHGIEVPNSTGLFGGLPGAVASHYLRRSNNDSAALLERYASANEVMRDPAARDIGAKPGSFRIGHGDVLAYTFQGGGGYGDPLRRDPGRVARDVATGFVTRRSAGDLYGVVLHDDGTVDERGTEALRDRIRTARLGRQPVKKPPQRSPANRPDFHVGSDRHFRCCCGADYGRADGDWKAKAHRAVVPPASCGPHVRLHEELELRAFSCTDCGTLLELEVCRKDEEPLRTVELLGLGPK